MKEIKVNMDIIEHSAISELRELARQEVLTRFAALQERVKSLDDSLELHADFRDKDIAKIVDLEEQVEDLKSFIYVVTLFLQSHKTKNDKDFKVMFDRSYKLYVRYKVEETIK